MVNFIRENYSKRRTEQIEISIMDGGGRLKLQNEHYSLSLER